MKNPAKLTLLVVLLLVSACSSELDVDLDDAATEAGGEDVGVEEVGGEVDGGEDAGDVHPGDDVANPTDDVGPDAAGEDVGDDADARPDPLSWVTDDLVLLYTFEEGTGATVNDRSGAAPAMDLQIQNASAATWSSAGLSFFSANSARSSGGANRVNEAIRNTGAITIDAWITPADADQAGPARIITSSVSTSQRNFTLGQHGTSLHGRVRTTEVGENGAPGAQSPEGLIGTNAVHTVFTRDAAGQATLYVDGNLVKSDLIGGDFSGWQLDYALALGSELSSERHWVGTYHRVAVYNRALDANDVEEHYQLGLQQLDFNIPDYTPPDDPWKDLGSPGAGGGFLWKPVAESDHRLVILFPSSYTDVATACYVVNAAGDLLEEGNFVGDEHNGGRQHYRFSKSGGEYGSDLYVIGVTPSGNVHWHIPDGSQRTEY
jgi:hypothetical protein